MTGGLSGRRRRLAVGLVLAAALAAIVPTVGDFGLTYDETAYRYSQDVSIQWWERLARARTRAELAALLNPDALLYYWPYARHGINFHPPLSGQLGLLTYAALGRWMKDIPARRMASALEYAATIALLFGFLARRYGGWVGLVASAALLTMPRVYGQAHLIDTDTTGMALWVAVALAFWKGLHEPGARRWRAAVGVLAGLAFVQKLGAVLVLLPLLAWLIVGHLLRPIRRIGQADWLDGLLTSAAMLAPLAVASAEVLRLAQLLPPPQFTDLFVDRPPSRLPGTVLLAPLGAWIVRRALARAFRSSPVWGGERPALETWTALLAFAPAVAWLGNPAWWRETMPRLAHYYRLNAARRGALPDILNLYFGRAYEFGLPWHSAWVLIALTVPATLLAAAAVGILAAFRRLAAGDRLPAFALLLMATPPALRLLPAPAHDGVRLILPAFPFLAALAGWGAIAAADGLARLRVGGVPASARVKRDRACPRGRGHAAPVDPGPHIRSRDAAPVARLRQDRVRAATAALVVLPAAWGLVRIHPFELSYYNALIGGPRGAWDAGLELSYWYDACTPAVLADLNARLPCGAAISYANDLSNPVMAIQDLQALGALRGDLTLWDPATGRFPFMWLLTHDSKATAFTRLLFALRPWYALAPPQLDGLRVVTVADPVAVSRAWALQLLTTAPAPPPRPVPPAAPGWVRRCAPSLARLWGDGLTRVAPPPIAGDAFAWAAADPGGLRAAARALASGRPVGPDDLSARRLRALLARLDDPARGLDYSGLLLRARPAAVLDAAHILLTRPAAVRLVLRRYPYTDPKTLGGYLDRDL